METLFAKQNRLLMLTSTEIIRTLMHQNQLERPIDCY